MKFNLEDIMSPAQHMAALERTDPARDSVAERHDAARAEVDAYLSTLPDWQQLVPYRLGEVMATTAQIMTGYRATYTCDLNGQLPYGDEILSDYTPNTVTPSYTPDPPGPVSIGLFLSNPNGSPTLERHYAFGSRTLPMIAADALAATRRDRGCDLRTLGPMGLHDSITKQSSRSVWPIGRGEFVVFVRYCSGCLGALFQKYAVAVQNCRIETPYRVG